MKKYRHKHISSTGTYVIAAGDAELSTVNINTGAGSATLTVYNSAAGSGDVVAVIDATTKSSHGFIVACPLGITAVLAGGNADVTIGSL